MEEPTSETGAAKEREVIDAARREAAELVERPERELPPPDSVPGFKIISEVGRGGMGVVYKAVQLSLNRIVAVKVMLAGPFASPAARRRFRREVELAAKFQHPGIVRVLDHGETSSGQPFYAMDFIDGVTLNRWLAETQPGIPGTVHLFAELCQAVDYAHDQQVIHRDLKPGNVLVDRDGKPHILDFGLSKALYPAEGQDTLTLYVSSPGQVMGTLPYLSPEQAAGKPTDIGPWTDVYALGVMLFETVNGSLPIELGGNPSKILQRIQEGITAPLRASGTRADRELETIIRKTLEREPPRRYQSAADFRADLERYLRNEPLLARPASRVYLARKKLFKHRARLGLAVMIVSVMVASLYGAGWWKQYRAGQQRAQELARARQGMLRLEYDLVRGVDGPIESVLSTFAQYPELPEVRLMRAVAEYRAGYSNAGRHLINPTKTDNPASWAYQRLLSELYRASGREDLAAELEIQAGREQPNTPEGWYLASFATLDRARALQAAQHAAELDPANLLIHQRLLYLHLANNDMQAALECTDRSIELAPQNNGKRLQRAYVLTALGRFDEAVAQYADAIARGLTLGEEYRAYRHRGYAHRGAGRYEQALADLETAWEIEHPLRGQASGWLLFQRVTPLWILGRTEEAAEACRRAHELLLIPTYGDARRFLILWELGRHEEAHRNLRVIRDRTANPFLNQIFAFLDHDIGADELIEAADTKARRCEAYYYAGEVALREGRTTEAVDLFRKSLDTRLLFDPGTWPPESMNEYELARWRLESLTNND